MNCSEYVSKYPDAATRFAVIAKKIKRCWLADIKGYEYWLGEREKILLNDSWRHRTFLLYGGEIIRVREHHIEEYSDGRWKLRKEIRWLAYEDIQNGRESFTVKTML